jgi:hypothetical protein
VFIENPLVRFSKIPPIINLGDYKQATFISNRKKSHNISLEMKKNDFRNKDGWF